jgi:hypothetical protein
MRPQLFAGLHDGNDIALLAAPGKPPGAPCARGAKGTRLLSMLIQSVFKLLYSFAEPRCSASSRGPAVDGAHIKGRGILHGLG